MPCIGNFGKEETMDLLQVIEEFLSIGSEGWNSVKTEHQTQLSGQGETALTRKFHPLLQSNPAGDPDCPEEVKLAKQIKHLTGNKIDLGETGEKFSLKEVELGKSGANPNLSSEPSNSPEEGRVAASSVTPSSSIIRRQVKREEPRRKNSSRLAN